MSLPDPVWNDPLPIDIQGNKFVVRELYAGNMKHYLREIVEIFASGSAGSKDAENKATLLVLAAKEKVQKSGNPHDPEAAALMSQAQAVLESSQVEGMFRSFEQAGDRVWVIMSESTGLTLEQISSMPGSAWAQLFREVVKANSAMVRDFFLAGQDLAEILAPFKAMVGMGKRSSSEPSSPPDSISTPSSTE
jgi:hypothetical protein